MVSYVYPFSVFYLSRSVFANAGRKLKNNEDNPSFSFLLKSVLFHLRYRRLICNHIVFAPKEIIDWAKTIEFENRFGGFMEIGENMAHSEYSPKIQGHINFKLLQYATDKDGEVEGAVKIIVDDEETERYLEAMRLSKDYPIEVISSSDALVELDEIEKKLKEEIVAGSVAIVKRP